MGQYGNQSIIVTHSRQIHLSPWRIQPVECGNTVFVICCSKSLLRQWVSPRPPSVPLFLWYCLFLGFKISVVSSYSIRDIYQIFVPTVFDVLTDLLEAVTGSVPQLEPKGSRHLKTSHTNTQMTKELHHHLLSKYETLYFPHEAVINNRRHIWHREWILWFRVSEKYL